MDHFENPVNYYLNCIFSILQPQACIFTLKQKRSRKLKAAFVISPVDE